jgi:hypothetical protein
MIWFSPVTFVHGMSSSSGLSANALWRAGQEAWFHMHAGEGDDLYFGKARTDLIRECPISLRAYFSRLTPEEIRMARLTTSLVSRPAAGLMT